MIPGIDMLTLKALYTTGVVCLFVGNCFAGAAYSAAHAKGASLVASIFSSIASIFWFATAIWLTCKISLDDINAAGGLIGLDLGWNYTYVYTWIGWLLCNGSASASYKHWKSCCEHCEGHDDVCVKQVRCKRKEYLA